MKYPALFGIGLSIASLLMLPCLARGNTHIGIDKTISCHYGQKNPMVSGEAKLSFKNKTIHRIWFNSYFPGGMGQLGFICHIDIKRGDKAYTWQDNDLGLTVTALETGDMLQLKHDKKGYWLDFAKFKTLSKYCGAGADLPLDVFIPLSGKLCKIRLSE